MQKQSNNERIFAVLTIVFLIYTPFGNIQANDASSAEVKGNASDFRIEVIIDGNANQPAEDTIKNKLLVEKLFKMGRAKSQGCTRCHGRSGIEALARSSKWEGSIAGFVVTALTAFREGTRIHEVMSSIVAPLSDQEIALIAGWYQSVSAPKLEK